MYGCSQTCRGTWPWCSPLCRWHPTVWPLSTSQVGVSSSSSYWLNPRVDVLEPALSQYKQDTIHLAWYEAQSCQERNGSTLQSASIPDRTYIREESWFHYRSRVKHEGPYHQTLPVVLLPASSNTHGSTLTYIISHPNFGPCLHLHASRFLQQPSLWDKCLPPWPSTISPKFGCSLDPQNSQIWSDLGSNSAWPSLASGSVSHSIQAQLHHEQLPGWPCTGVPDRAMPLRDWRSSKAQPSVIVPGSAPGPSISEGTIREKRFLRLLTTAVEIASCRHPTSPQRASTFPEETQNSLYATVHVMPLRIYVNSVNSTTTTTTTIMLHYVTLRYIRYITLHYVTSRYITLHHVTLRYITLHYVTLRYITLHYVTLRYITLHYVTLRYITLHYVTLRYVTLRYVTLRYVTLRTLRYVTLRYVTLRYVTLRYVTLRYVTLRYVTLRYVTLHYVTLHYITLHYIGGWGRGGVGEGVVSTTQGTLPPRAKIPH